MRRSMLSCFCRASSVYKQSQHPKYTGTASKQNISTILQDETLCGSTISISVSLLCMLLRLSISLSRLCFLLSPPLSLSLSVRGHKKATAYIICGPRQIASAYYICVDVSLFCFLIFFLHLVGNLLFGKEQQQQSSMRCWHSDFAAIRYVLSVRRAQQKRCIL